MKQDVAKWVEKCPACQLIKAEHKFLSGLLQNFPIPEYKWDHITLDFVTGLPTTRNQNDAAGFVMDRLSKSAHFIAIKKTDGVGEIVRKYMDEIVHQEPSKLL
ncbi:hypothetical protein N665_0592s0006 [Sinapis alba]|nr:hypothetical protein N665_0592s0006 [Sinapis alba]